MANIKQYQLDDNDEVEVYILGMDLFTLLSFFWLTAFLLNPTVIPVSGKATQNGTGAGDKALMIYVSKDGKALSLKTTDAPPVAMTTAGGVVRKLLAKEHPTKVILAVPASLPTGSTHHIIDALMGWLTAEKTSAEIELLAMTQGGSSR